MICFFKTKYFLSRSFLVLFAVAIFSVTPLTTNSHSLLNYVTSPTMTAQAKAFYWKYGTCWFFTSKVNRLINKSGTKKYRVYESKTDISDSYSTWGALLGGNVGGMKGTIIGLVGSLYHPKHGIRFDITYHHAGTGITSNVHKWH